MIRPEPLYYSGIPDLYKEALEAYCDWLECRPKVIQKYFEDEIKTKTHWGQREILRAYRGIVTKGERGYEK